MRSYNLILYCNARVPTQEGDEREHWKEEIPDVGVTEVIHDFYRTGVFGAFRVFHAVVKEDQLARVQDFMDDFNSSKPPPQQIHYWTGATAEESWMATWYGRDDVHSIVKLVIEATLNYPVSSETGDPEHPILATVKVARDTYLLTIDDEKVMIPHKFLGA